MPQFPSFFVVGESPSAHFVDRSLQQAFPRLGEKGRSFGRQPPKSDQGAGSRENASSRRFLSSFEPIAYFGETSMITGRMEPGRKIISQSLAPYVMARSSRDEAIHAARSCGPSPRSRIPREGGEADPWVASSQLLAMTVAELTRLLLGVASVGR
jgi:hypothetical protein